MNKISLAGWPPQKTSHVALALGHNDDESVLGDGSGLEAPKSCELSAALILAWDRASRATSDDNKELAVVDNAKSTIGLTDVELHRCQEAC